MDQSRLLSLSLSLAQNLIDKVDKVLYLDGNAMVYMVSVLDFGSWFGIYKRGRDARRKF